MDSNRCIRLKLKPSSSRGLRESATCRLPSSLSVSITCMPFSSELIGPTRLKSVTGLNGNSISLIHRQAVEQPPNSLLYRRVSSKLGEVFIFVFEAPPLVRSMILSDPLLL